MLAPVAPVVAFEQDEGPLAERTITVNGTETAYLTLDWLPAVAQYFGLPVTTAPVGTSASGLPVGLQFLAPLQGDDRPTIVPNIQRDSPFGRSRRTRRP